MSAPENKPRLLVIGPVPPPYHGVTVSTTLVLANQALRRHFRVEHVDTSDHRTGQNLGRWDVTNIFGALWGVVRLARRLHGPPGVVYLPLSQNRAGLLRDGLFILVAAARGWAPAVHLRGSDFPWFYPALDPVFRRWIRFTLARAASFGVMGEALRGVFGDLADPARVAVVSNGTPDAELIAQPGKSRRVLFLANRRIRKGVLESLEAARIVLERVPDVEFAFVGNPDTDDLEADLAERAALGGGRIQLLPPATGHDKARHYASAALLLFPPVEPEGHPRVVLEAVAAGLPVVATDRGAISETVKHGVNGYVLDGPEPELLAERVIELLEDPQLRDRMGAESLKLHRERFTQAKADERLAEWLAALVPPR